MKLTALEVKTCLLWMIKPYLDKYHIEIHDATLEFNDICHIDAQMDYGKHIIVIQGSCDIFYQEGYLVFQQVKGKVDYMFVSVDLMQVLSQYIHHENIIINDHNIYFKIPLPIQKIIIEDEHLYLKLIEM